MSTKKELEDKKDYARLLYMQGEQQKTIAEKAGSRLRPSQSG